MVGWGLSASKSHQGLGTGYPSRTSRKFPTVRFP